MRSKILGFTIGEAWAPEVMYTSYEINAISPMAAEAYVRLSTFDRVIELVSTFAVVAALVIAVYGMTLTRCMLKSQQNQMNQDKKMHKKRLRKMKRYHGRQISKVNKQISIEIWDRKIDTVKKGMAMALENMRQHINHEYRGEGLDYIMRTDGKNAFLVEWAITDFQSKNSQYQITFCYKVLPVTGSGLDDVRAIVGEDRWWDNGAIVSCMSRGESMLELKNVRSEFPDNVHYSYKSNFPILDDIDYDTLVIFLYILQLRSRDRLMNNQNIMKQLYNGRQPNVRSVTRDLQKILQTHASKDSENSI